MGKYWLVLYYGYVKVLWASHEPLVPSFTYNSLLFLLSGVCAEFHNFYLQRLGIN